MASRRQRVSPCVGNATEGRRRQCGSGASSLYRVVDEADDGEAANALDVHLDIDASRLETDGGVRDRAREHANAQGGTRDGSG
jgi:hypothetical protein